jgi:hypothetical protein
MQAPMLHTSGGVCVRVAPTRESGGGQCEGRVMDAPPPQKKSGSHERWGMGTLGGCGHKEDVATRNSTWKGLEGKASCAGAHGERAKGGRARSRDEARPRESVRAR